jgi:transcriptional regulator with XRE-family HTH domain
VAKRSSSVQISGEKLARLRTEVLHLSQQGLAEKVGMSLSGVQLYERSEPASLRSSNFLKLADLVKETPADLAKKLAAKPATLDPNVEPYSEQKFFEIPTFDLAVSAGGWTEASEVAEVSDPNVLRQGLFRIRIRGDSMKNAWVPGEVAEFKLIRWGMDELKIGADYYVHRADNLATFKRLVSVNDDEYTFAALNKKKYPEQMAVARQDVVRMAKAVGKFVPME